MNKDAIIDDIKDAAVESVVGGMGAGALPIGAPDLAPPADQASVPQGPSMGLPIPGSPF